jgi:hypothetical protein
MNFSTITLNNEVFQFYGESSSIQINNEPSWKFQILKTLGGLLTHSAEELEEMREEWEWDKKVTLLEEAGTLIFEYGDKQTYYLQKHKEFLQGLKRLCEDTFFEKFSDSLETCPITLEPIRKKHKLSCGHCFEKSAIFRVNPRNCPMCRKPF